MSAHTMLTRKSVDALAASLISAVTALPDAEMKAVTDRIVAAVTVEQMERRRRAEPVPPPLPYEPKPEPEISPEEAAARALDTERWGECCYCEDEPRPHHHCAPWPGHGKTGFHRHVFDRETGKEIG